MRQASRGFVPWDKCRTRSSRLWIGPPADWGMDMTNSQERARYLEQVGTRLNRCAGGILRYGQEKGAISDSSPRTGPHVNDTTTGAASSDPVIRAMREELERSKSQVKMENVSAPYYIEYRLTDMEEFTAEAAIDPEAATATADYAGAVSCADS